MSGKFPFLLMALPPGTHGFQIAMFICPKLAEGKVLERSHGERFLWARSACDTHIPTYVPLAKIQSRDHT